MQGFSSNGNAAIGPGTSADIFGFGGLGSFASKYLSVGASSAVGPTAGSTLRLGGFDLPTLPAVANLRLSSTPSPPSGNALLAPMTSVSSPSSSSSSSSSALFSPPGPGRIAQYAGAGRAPRQLAGATATSMLDMVAENGSENAVNGLLDTIFEEGVRTPMQVIMRRGSVTTTSAGAPLVSVPAPPPPPFNFNIPASAAKVPFASKTPSSAITGPSDNTGAMASSSSSSSSSASPPQFVTLEAVLACKKEVDGLLEAWHANTGRGSETVSNGRMTGAGSTAITTSGSSQVDVESMLSAYGRYSSSLLALLRSQSSSSEVMRSTEVETARRDWSAMRKAGESAAAALTAKAAEHADLNDKHAELVNNFDALLAEAEGAATELEQVKARLAEAETARDAYAVQLEQLQRQQTHKENDSSSSSSGSGDMIRRLSEARAVAEEASDRAAMAEHASASNARRAEAADQRARDVEEYYQMQLNAAMAQLQQQYAQQTQHQASPSVESELRSQVADLTFQRDELRTLLEEATTTMQQLKESQDAATEAAVHAALTAAPLHDHHRAPVASASAGADAAVNTSAGSALTMSTTSSTRSHHHLDAGMEALRLSERMAKAEAAVLSSQIQHARAQVDELQSRLNAESSSRASSDGTIAGLRNRITDLESQLTSTIERMTSSDTASSTSSQLSSMLIAKAQRVAQLEGQITLLQIDAEASKAQCKSMADAVATMQARCTTAEREYHDAASRCGALQEQSSDAHAAVLDLQSQCEAMRSRIGELLMAVTDRDQQLEDMHNSMMMYGQQQQSRGNSGAASTPVPKASASSTFMSPGLSRSFIAINIAATPATLRKRNLQQQEQEQQRDLLWDDRSPLASHDNDSLQQPPSSLDVATEAMSLLAQLEQGVASGGADATSATTATITAALTSRIEALAAERDAYRLKCDELAVQAATVRDHLQATTMAVMAASPQLLRFPGQDNDANNNNNGNAQFDGGASGFHHKQLSGSRMGGRALAPAFASPAVTKSAHLFFSPASPPWNPNTPSTGTKTASMTGQAGRGNSSSSTALASFNPREASLQALQIDNRRMGEQVLALQSIVDSQAREVSRISSLLAAARASATEADRRVESARGERDALAAQLTSIQQSVESARLAVQDGTADLRTQLESCQDALAKAQSQLAMRTAELASARDEVERLTGYVDVLEDRLAKGFGGDANGDAGGVQHVESETGAAAAAAVSSTVSFKLRPGTPAAAAPKARQEEAAAVTRRPLNAGSIIAALTSVGPSVDSASSAAHPAASAPAAPTESDDAATSLRSHYEGQLSVANSRMASLERIVIEQAAATQRLREQMVLHRLGMSVLPNDAAFDDGSCDDSTLGLQLQEQQQEEVDESAIIAEAVAAARARKQLHPLVEAPAAAPVDAAPVSEDDGASTPAPAGSVKPPRVLRNMTVGADGSIKFEYGAPSPIGAGKAVQGDPAAVADVDGPATFSADGGAAAAEGTAPSTPRQPASSAAREGLGTPTLRVTLSTVDQPAWGAASANSTGGGSGKDDLKLQLASIAARLRAVEHDQQASQRGKPAAPAPVPTTRAASVPVSRPPLPGKHLSQHQHLIQGSEVLKSTNLMTAAVAAASRQTLAQKPAAVPSAAAAAAAVPRHPVSRLQSILASVVAEMTSDRNAGLPLDQGLAGYRRQLVAAIHAASQSDVKPAPTVAAAKPKKSIAGSSRQRRHTIVTKPADVPATTDSTDAAAHRPSQHMPVIRAVSAPRAAAVAKQAPVVEAVPASAAPQPEQQPSGGGGGGPLHRRFRSLASPQKLTAPSASGATNEHWEVHEPVAAAPPSSSSSRPVIGPRSTSAPPARPSQLLSVAPAFTTAAPGSASTPAAQPSPSLPKLNGPAASSSTSSSMTPPASWHANVMHQPPQHQAHNGPTRLVRLGTQQQQLQPSQPLFTVAAPASTAPMPSTMAMAPGTHHSAMPQPAPTPSFSLMLHSAPAQPPSAPAAAMGGSHSVSGSSSIMSRGGAGAGKPPRPAGAAASIAASASAAPSRAATPTTATAAAAQQYQRHPAATSLQGIAFQPIAHAASTSVPNAGVAALDAGDGDWTTLEPARY